jgi:hypothetical protein
VPQRALLKAASFSRSSASESDDAAALASPKEAEEEERVATEVRRWTAGTRTTARGSCCGALADSAWLFGERGRGRREVRERERERE